MVANDHRSRYESTMARIRAKVQFKILMMGMATPACDDGHRDFHADCRERLDFHLPRLLEHARNLRFQVFQAGW